MATVEKTVGKGRIFVNALPNPSNIKDIPLRAPASTKLSTTMATLGTEVVQKFTPINNFKVQVSTMRHVAGDLDRQLQCESYVTWLNEDMAQILLFDNVESEARLIGVEYSISDKLFQELPQEEKMMWAPKAWSVVNGIETLPRVMNMVEKGILDEEVHFYSKGWLVWDICSGKILPTGLPQLLVPFTGDGQVSKRLVDGRDDYWNVTTDKLAYSRQNLKFSAPLPGANDGMTPFQLAVVGAAGAMGAGAMGAGGMGSAGRGGMPQAGVGGYDSGYGQQGVGSQGYGQQGIGQSGYGTGSGDVGQTGLGHTQAGYGSGIGQSQSGIGQSGIGQSGIGQSGIGQSGIGHGAGVSQGGMGTQSGYGVGQGQSGYGGGVGESGAGYGSQAGLGQTGTGYGTSGLPGTSILGQGSQGVGSGLGHTGTGGTGVTGGIGSRLEEGAYDIARGSTSASRGY